MSASSEPSTLDEAAFRALRRGDANARDYFSAALVARPGDPALLIGDAEARFAAGEKRPWSSLDRALAAQPRWAEGQRLRAALRWEMGLGTTFADGLRGAIAAVPGDAGLWNTLIGVLAGVGDYQGAADVAHDAHGRFSAPILRLIEADNAGFGGDRERATRLLATLPKDFPGRALGDVRQALRVGDGDAAEAILARERARDPASLVAWALTDLAWRLTGDRRAEWLGGQEKLIATLDLEIEPADLALLAATLRILHRQRAAPLGQSVRGGTQTRGPLFERAGPAIRGLHRALQAALDRYRAALPPIDAAHPLLRHRDASLAAKGGWSVRLEGAGFHVPHLHPAGIVSSACYIAVPALDSASHEGWLEIGMPPLDLNLPLPSRSTIEPRPGRLVLFPSYLYHGTRAFAAGERLSVAFDAS